MPISKNFAKLEKLKRSDLKLRETGVSRHHRDSIKGTTQTFQTSQSYDIEELNGCPQLGVTRMADAFLTSLAEIYSEINVQPEIFSN